VAHDLPTVRTDAREGEPADVLLLWGSPEEVLARLVADDPLRLRTRCLRRLRSQDLLYDADALVDRLRARIARDASGWRGTPGLEAFLGERLGEVVAGCRDGDREGGRDPVAGAFPLLARIVGIDARELEAACRRFNRLPRRDRARLRELVFEGLTPVEVARRAAEPLLSLRERLEGLARKISSDPERRRRIWTGLRLLRDEALGRGTELAGAELRAREELRRLVQEELLDTLHALARHLVRAILPAEGFLHPEEPRLAWASAWTRIERMRGEGIGVPDVPSPQETPLEVLSRVHEALRAVGASSFELALLRAYRLHARGRNAHEAWLRLVRRGEDEGERAEALLGLLAAYLERGEVRAAHELCERHAEIRARDSRLGWIAVWTLLLLGDPEGAGARARGLGAPRVLPAPLRELREEVEAWAGLLRGGAAAAVKGPVPADGDRGMEGVVPSLGELGASCLAVFSLRAGERLEVCHLEARPGMGDHALRLALEREGAWRRACEPEHELLLHGAIVRRHRGGSTSAAAAGGELRGALGKGARSLALVPLRDEGGEVEGWLHVELDHHLLPVGPRLERLAERCRVALLRRTLARRSDVDPGDEGVCRLLLGLGLGLARRRLSLVELSDEGLEVRGSVGEVLVDARQGSGLALRRARRVGAPVCFDEGEPSMGLSEDAVSGCAVPLGEASGSTVLVVSESPRRGDHALTARGMGPRLRGLFLEWRIEGFRRWHAERFGFRPGLDPHARFWSRQLEALCGLARSAMPVFLHGPEGCGKKLVARLLSFESGERLHIVHLETEGLDPVELLELSRTRRVVLLSREPWRGSGAAAGLDPELSEWFERSAIRIPGLDERRDEIAGLVRSLARRFADEERLRVPRFDAEVLAWLWRQAWPGNVRELARLVTRFVLCGVDEVTLGVLETEARAIGMSLRRRVPSRRPRRELLDAALDEARNKNGSINKTRAARLLGWDPDTLARHLARVPCSQ